NRHVFAQNLREACRCAFVWPCRIEDAEIVAGPADRIEYRLARRQEPELIRPTMIIGRAVGILSSNLKHIGGIVRGPRAAFVRAVLTNQQRARERMAVGCEANRIAIPITPREWLDGVFRMSRV